MAFNPSLKYLKPALNLSEAEIKYTADKVYSNREASLFLKISIDSWKKYAKLYIEPTTGLTYHEFLKRKKQPKKPKGTSNRIPMEDIFSNQYPLYKPYKLKMRLIREGYKNECCDFCGFGERRASDYTVPLLLHFADANPTNHALENLKFICYNCYFLLEGSRFGKKAIGSNYSKKTERTMPEYEGY